MKKLLSLSAILMFSSIPALSFQTQDTGRLKGRVVDIAGGPIPKVPITIHGSEGSFKVTSDEDGYYGIEMPSGNYQLSSERLSGFAATGRTGVRVERGKIVEVNIVPAVSSEGVVCYLHVTAAPVKEQNKKQKRLKRRR